MQNDVNGPMAKTDVRCFGF